MAKQNKSQEASSITGDFFTQNPSAPSVLKVGDTLFLTTSQSVADQYAAKCGMAVEVVLNPNLNKEPLNVA